MFYYDTNWIMVKTNITKLCIYIFSIETLKLLIINENIGKT